MLGDLGGDPRQPVPCALVRNVGTGTRFDHLQVALEFGFGSRRPHDHPVALGGADQQALGRRQIRVRFGQITPLGHRSSGQRRGTIGVQPGHRRTDPRRVGDPETQRRGGVQPVPARQVVEQILDGPTFLAQRFDEGDHPHHRADTVLVPDGLRIGAGADGLLVPEPQAGGAGDPFEPGQGAPVSQSVMFGDPGAEIMYPDPGFPIYRSMIEYTGAKPVPVPIREENGFGFSAEETLALINEKTRLIIINSPANPTGGVTSRDEIVKLVKGLEKWPDVAIMSDEIYDVMTYDGEKHTSLLQFPEIRDRLIVLNGWSKTWAMTGWRLGWSIWPDQLIDKVRKLAVNCWSCVNAPSQFAGIAAIDGPQDDVAVMMEAFDRRRKLVVELANGLPGVSCETPKGAFYAFPNIKETGWKAKELASALLEKSGVATIGGPDFGILGEGYIRLSYANSEENITRALERIGEFLGKNSK